MYDIARSFMSRISSSSPPTKRPAWRVKDAQEFVKAQTWQVNKVEIGHVGTSDIEDNAISGERKFCGCISSRKKDIGWL